ncbi:hypothetical protein L3X38_026674 [Prunus dulcis]|uniref:Uncharacterized protein n=1 Tax=Prunus dulcis TaxID=3755 RepID=A0AAD4Z0F5_PRUDU|nr:hypothetical protein L3X38_026674 [Prunus dulcis]
MPITPVVSSSLPPHVTSSSSSAYAPISELSPSVAQARINTTAALLLSSPNLHASAPTSTVPIFTSSAHSPTQTNLAQPPSYLSPIRTYTRNPHRTIVTFPSSDPYTPTPPPPIPPCSPIIPWSPVPKQISTNVILGMQ